jgi:hypothetical protein
MFTRSVSVRRKANSLAEFTRLIEKEALPLLRKEEGLQDEITLVVPAGMDGVAFSLWVKLTDLSGGRNLPSRSESLQRLGRSR